MFEGQRLTNITNRIFRKERGGLLSAQWSSYRFGKEIFTSRRTFFSYPDSDGAHHPGDIEQQQGFFIRQTTATFHDFSVTTLSGLRSLFFRNKLEVSRKEDRGDHREVVRRRGKEAVDDAMVAIDRLGYAFHGA